MTNMVAQLASCTPRRKGRGRRNGSAQPRRALPNRSGVSQMRASTGPLAGLDLVRDGEQEVQFRLRVAAVGCGDLAVVQERRADVLHDRRTLFVVHGFERLAVG